MITIVLQNNKGLKRIRFYDYTQDAICQNTAQALVDYGQQIEHLEIFQNLDYDTHAILTKLKHLKSIKFCHYSMTLAPENLKLMSLNQSQLEEIQLPLYSLSESYDEFFANLKDTLKRLKLTFNQSNHLWTFESLHKLVNLSELELQHVYDQFDDIQIVNLAKISSWKVFKFAGQYCESTDPLIKLFSSLKTYKLHC